MSDSAQINIKKSLISLAIEKTLLKTEKAKSELFLSNLSQMKICISDCDENPLALKNILETVYEGTSKILINDIEAELIKYSDKKIIIEFIDKLKE